MYFHTLHWLDPCDILIINHSSYSKASGKGKKVLAEYSVQEMARRFGVSAHTVRYYENEKLLPEVGRDAHGARVFTDEHVNWLNMVLCLRATGMSIGDVRHYIELCEQGDSTLRERYEIMLRQKERAEEELREVQRKFEVLSHKLSLYENLLAEKEREA